MQSVSVRMTEKVLLLLLLLLLVAGQRGERRSRRQCRSPEGKLYAEGESYTEDCVTFTCTKLAKKMMTLVPSVIGKCCEVKSRGLYKAGEIIETTHSGPGNCTRTTMKCDLTPHDRPQITVTTDTDNCCMYRGRPARLGERFPVPEKCAWLECR